jgi:hypothetical protein
MEETETQAADVVVTVGADNQPVCTPDTVRARGRNVVLKFEVQTAGYVFPASAAVVVDDAGTQFPEPSRTVGPKDTVALLLDLNTDKAVYKYTVAVQRVASGEVLRLDPAIQNGD